MIACYTAFIRRSFKQSRVAFLQQEKVTRKGIFIRPQNVRQRLRREFKQGQRQVTSTKMSLQNITLSAIASISQLFRLVHAMYNIDKISCNWMGTKVKIEKEKIIVV